MKLGASSIKYVMKFDAESFYSDMSFHYNISRDERPVVYKETTPVNSYPSKINSPRIDTLLMQTLNESNMVVCVKDINKVVLKQNDACKTLCENREGEACVIGCMEIYEADSSQQWARWGNRTYKNRYLHNDYYNVSLLCSEQHLITILQPLDKQYSKAIEYYKNIGLSKRELEVISLVITGSSNIDICDELNISNATLRTHLNKVYSKVRETGGTPEFLPEKRK